MKFKGVLYDLGDVFFEAHYWRKWNYDELRQTGFFEGDFMKFNDLYESFLIPVYENRISYEEGFDSFLQTLGVSNEDMFKKRSFMKKKEFEKSRVLFPGVKATLKRLHNYGIKNIIITDNDLTEDEIRKKVIARFGINPFLDFIVSSREIGVKKPSPEIFDKALNRASLKRNEVVFVGHEKDEIDGCRDLGIHTILFNNYLGTTIDSTYYIVQFSEIYDIVH